MAGLLDFLLSDPTGASPGGGLLSKIFGLNTPTMQAPGQQSPYGSAGYPFNYQKGLFGNSMLGNALRGGMAGLAGSTGYTGLSALGAGAEAGEQSAVRRQLLNQQNLLGNQQFQAGQQGLVGGNLTNIFALERVNAMRQHFGLPPVNMQDLIGNPNLLNDPTGRQQQGQAMPPQGAPPTLNPVAQGGQPESVWQQPQGQPQTLTKPQQPQSGLDDVAASLRNQADMYYAQGELGKGAEAEAKLAEYLNAPSHAAATTAATGEATAGGTPKHWENLNTIVTQHNGDPAIVAQQQVTQLAPTFFAAANAGADPKTGKQADFAGDPVTDQQLVGLAARIFNPGLRLRGGNMVVEEDIPNIDGEIQHLIRGYVAGKSHLPAAERDSLINLVKTKLQTTDQLYSTAYGKLANRAKDMGISEDEFGGTPRIAMTQAAYDNLPKGAQYYAPDGQLHVKQ